MIKPFKLMVCAIALLGAHTNSQAQLSSLINKKKKKQKKETVSTNTNKSSEKLDIQEEVRTLETYREIERIRFAELYNFISGDSSAEEVVSIDATTRDSINTAIEKERKEKKLKLSKFSKDFPNLKYRRSSLYTLMVDDSKRQFANNIANSFASFHISEKFNEHNVGPYLIQGKGGDKEQLPNIKKFLEEKQIAKKLVARWFNRNDKGEFNMDLVAERGFYSASDLDIKNAENSQRGLSILGDAGEELIKNTFVVINDYKFTNKEDVAKATGSLLKLAGALTGNAEAAEYTNAAVNTVGKGYIIKVNSYLFKLDWNEEVAGKFYTDFWVDKNYFDENKKKAFEEANIFKLIYVGVQGATADVQSTIFSGKSNKDLIIKSTLKASDKSVVKLQRQYEEFRTKTPLYSVNPLSAKIGTKEGIEKGDKFEVLEQIINKEGKTEYKRKAIIKVDSKKIWNNSFAADGKEQEQEIHRTYFTGGSKGLYAGMLIRQIK